MNSFNSNRFNRDIKRNSTKAINYLTKYLADSNVTFESDISVFNADNINQLEKASTSSLFALEKVLLTKKDFPRLRFIIQSFSEAERLYQKFDAFLEKICFEEVLIYCGYLLRWKEDPQSQFDDVNAFDTINSILNRKLRLIQKKGESLNSKYNVENFDKLTVQLLTKIAGEKPFFLFLVELYQAFDQANQLKYIVKKAILLNTEIKYQNDSFKLIPNKEKLNTWKLADFKYKFRHEYNSIKYLETKRHPQLATDRQSKYYHQYITERYPEKVCFINGTSFQVINFFRLTEALAYSSKMMKNELLHNVSYKDWLQFFRKAGGKDTKTIIDFLSTDLNQIPNIDIGSYPFLKIDNKIYSFPGHLVYKNYTAMLSKKIATDKRIEFSHKDWGKEASFYIASILEKNRFEKVLAEVDDIDGLHETDIVFFKDNTLFICEVKYTYPRDTIKEICDYAYLNKNSTEKAISQSEIRIKDLSSPKVLETLLGELGISTIPDNLKIIPLIINNTFERDGAIQLSNGIAYKLSITELEALISNKPYQLSKHKICGGKELYHLIKGNALWNLFMIPHDIMTRTYCIYCDNFKIHYQA